MIVRLRDAGASMTTQNKTIFSIGCPLFTVAPRLAPRYTFKNQQQGEKLKNICGNYCYMFQNDRIFALAKKGAVAQLVRAQDS